MVAILSDTIFSQLPHAKCACDACVCLLFVDTQQLTHSDLNCQSLSVGQVATQVPRQKFGTDTGWETFPSSEFTHLRRAKLNSRDLIAAYGEFCYSAESEIS